MKREQVAAETNEVFWAIYLGKNTLSKLKNEFPRLHESSLKRRLCQLMHDGRIRYVRKPENLAGKTLLKVWVVQ